MVQACRSLRPTSKNISSLLPGEAGISPQRSFSSQVTPQVLAAYRKLWRESVTGGILLGKQAKQELQWAALQKVLQWKEPLRPLVRGRQLNVSANCLDRWLGTATANKAALIWERPATDGKPGEAGAHLMAIAGKSAGLPMS